MYYLLINIKTIKENLETTNKKYIFTLLFFDILYLIIYYIKKLNKIFLRERTEMFGKDKIVKTLNIEGMNCMHCVKK